VVEDVAGKTARFEFRGGVRPEYFAEARVVFTTGAAAGGTVSAFAPETHRGEITVRGPMPVPGDIARWRLAARPAARGRFFAPACDDLAGCAAALAALDRARRTPEMSHFGVLLTRAEEMGFVGALHAAAHGTIPADSRVFSVETSRASSETPVGGGPVIRVGDASSVFDHGLTNLITDAARVSGIAHQRRLMAGGSCEATAFHGYGFRAAGLCLALGNYHNMGRLDEVEAGRGLATPMMEEISLDDLHSLVDLLLLAASAVDGESTLRRRLESVYAEGRHLLS
jgi:endoglucanase